MKQIGVIGSSGVVSENVRAAAEEVGVLIAKRGGVVICGGRDGVMEAVCKGAKSAGGLTVGVLPTDRKEDANRYVDIVIVTGMGDARNVINVRSGDAVIAIGGGSGTLSEIGLALKAKKKVIGLHRLGGAAELMVGRAMGGSKVLVANSPEDAVRQAFE